MLDVLWAEMGKRGLEDFNPPTKELLGIRNFEGRINILKTPFLAYTVDFGFGPESRF